MKRYITTIATLVCLHATSVAQSDSPRDLAKRIVAQSGIRAGLCVHLGCGDGTLMTELAKPGKFLVHGLDSDAASIKKARSALQSQGIYGRVSVETSSLKTLPYADNLVNLLVADMDEITKQAPSQKEILRVLVPNGVAYLKQNGKWHRTVKPRPKEMADWPQFHGGPGRNPVSKDRMVGPPSRLRWIDEPLRSRSHSGTTRCAVSAGGRLFYPIDEAESGVDGPVRLYLHARDAYNGLLLWKRPVAVYAKASGHRLGRGNPFNAGLRAILAATSERVFTVLKPNGPLVALDAASGKLITTYAVPSPSELILLPGKLLLADDRQIRMLDAASGKVEWTRRETIRTVLAGDGRAIYLAHRSAEIVCLDATNGKQQWRIKASGMRFRMLSHVSGVFLATNSKRTEGVVRPFLNAYSAKDGSLLWSRQSDAYLSSSPYVIDGQVWMWRRAGKGDSREERGARQAYSVDLWTGKEKSVGGKVFQTGGNVCHVGGQPATAQWCIHGRTFYTDWKTGANTRVPQVRGSCGLGLVLANGLSYSWPTDCHCSPYMKGMMALSTASAKSGDAQADPLQRGPAFGRMAEPAPKVHDWPSYRHDAVRSGSTAADVVGNIKPLWDQKLPATPTAPVMANGLLFVGSKDGQQVHALDAHTGKPKWSYAAGGPVDTPPTIYKGHCLFGCRDGWVYCLRATDGELVWRFRAAPDERRILAFGRLESPWPVHGAVLVENGIAYFAAGRHTDLDGGIFVYALDAKTGRLIWHEQGEKTGLCDLPVKDGEHLYIHDMIFDLKTGKPDHRADPVALRAPSLLTTPIWAHRNRWIKTLGRADVSGHILSFRNDVVFGVEAFPKYTNKHNLKAIGKDGYELFARSKGEGRQAIKLWQKMVPIRMQAIVLAGDTLFGAGSPDIANAKDPWAAIDGKLGGELRAFSANDGKELQQLKIDALPVLDGLIAAGGRLFLATKDGKVRCYGSIGRQK